MTYKDIAVRNEIRLREKCERLEVLLANAITILEEQQVFDTHKRLLQEFGLTEKEYKHIMGD